MAKRKSTKEQTTRSTNTKHTHKTKDRVTRSLLKTGGELKCSTSGIRRVNLVIKRSVTPGQHDYVIRYL